MRRAFFLAVILAGCGVPGLRSSDAHDPRLEASISGLVSDAETGQGIGGARIYERQGLALLAEADASGIFHAEGLHPGPVEIEVRAEKYDPREITAALEKGSNRIQVGLLLASCNGPGAVCSPSDYCDARTAPARCRSRAGAAELLGRVLDYCTGYGRLAAWRVNGSPLRETDDNGEFTASNLNVGDRVRLDAYTQLSVFDSWDVSLPGPINPSQGRMEFVPRYDHSCPELDSCPDPAADPRCGTYCAPGYHYVRELRVCLKDPGN